MNFLSEYQKLRDSQPRIALLNINPQNSEFCSYCLGNKDSYMLFGSDENERSMYSNWIYYNADCVDCGFCYWSELLYECLDCTRCYNCDYCQDCENANDSSYCYDCVGCSDCFGCVGLRHKKYYMFNEQLTKEEYERAVSLWKEKGHAATMEAFERMKRTVPRKYMHERQTENCTGDYIYEARNTFHSFDVQKIEDSMYMNNVLDVKDCYDCSYMHIDSQGNYECMSVLNSYNCMFCTMTYYCADVLYGEQLWNCHDCLGCVTLKRKEYCILNKQYPKEEYFKLKDEIVAELKQAGQFGKHIPSVYEDPWVYGL